MNRTQLFEQIQKKQSYLCVGLDTDLSKIPTHLLRDSDPAFSFNKAIIDATAMYCVAYKPNTAFYEANGSKGWQSLEKTVAYIRENYPEQFIIADAKRGDIGNTSTNYARAFFDGMNVDALTVAPYMGFDSIQPFLAFENRWTIVLALTSNSGSKDFQYLNLENSNRKLYEEVLSKVSSWADPEKVMFVVGATHCEELGKIREMLLEYFFLVPGIGSQGGDLQSISKVGLNAQCGLLVNSSRGIIYAGTGIEFAEKAAVEAKKIQQQMRQILTNKGSF
ncbi:MAG: orotidine-5'-phosphate decarboxylase [Lentimicrobiaceae bacterium]|jgi:orotidine-5'-phosphate decarboxylase|nr:orotidine-5'-phosphate decarboxylase [Lentimicrobiaceae bacterium]